MHVWLVCIHSHIHSIGYSSVKCIHYKWTGASSTVYVGHGYDVDVSIANYVPYCLRPNEISTKLLSHFPYSRNLSFAPSNPPTPPSFTLRKGIRLWTGGGGDAVFSAAGLPVILPRVRTRCRIHFLHRRFLSFEFRSEERNALRWVGVKKAQKSLREKARLEVNYGGSS